MSTLISDKHVVKSFVAHYTPGPNWLKGKPLKDQPLKAHVDYLLALHDRGKLIMAGPLHETFPIMRHSPMAGGLAPDRGPLEGNER